MDALPYGVWPLPLPVPTVPTPAIWPNTLDGSFAERVIPALGTSDFDIDVSAAPINTGISIQYRCMAFVVGASPGGAWEGFGVFVGYRSNAGALINSSGGNFTFASGGEGLQGATPAVSSAPDPNTFRITVASLGAWTTRFRLVYALALLPCGAPIIP